MNARQGWIAAWARVVALVLIVAGVSLWRPAPALAAGLPGTYVSLTPARVLDTRIGLGAPGPVAANSTIHVQIAGRGGVPSSGVAAVVINVTATNAAMGGYVTVYPDGLARPLASNLNYPAGDTRANLVTVKLGSNGKIALASSNRSSVQLIGDVSGYYRAGVPSASGSFVSLNPARVLDTRAGNGARGPIAANSTIHVQIAGCGGVPSSGVAAVVINVTATNAMRGGYLTVYGGDPGETPPGVSNLNYPAGDTRAVLVIVSLGSNGKIAVASRNLSTVQLVGDISGYIIKGTSSAEGSYNAVWPNRVLDTRIGAGVKGPVPPNSTIRVQVTGDGGIPSDRVSAVVLNVTVTNALRGGYLTVYPDGTTRPVTSNLNYPAGDTRSNLVIVKPGTDGKVAMASSNLSSVQLIGDVVGYYLMPLAPVTCDNPMTIVLNPALEPTLYGPITFSLQSSGPVTVDWGGGGGAYPAPSGSGQVQTYAPNPGDVGYYYGSDGTYTVRICGPVTRFSAKHGSGTLTRIPSFGQLGTTDYTGAFWYAYSLAEVSSTLPSTATNLTHMFTEADTFNDPNITYWDTSHVTNMSYMFEHADAFNQNLGGWNVSQVTNMTGMFSGVTLSTANYDALLIGWAKQPVQHNVTFSGGNSKFSSAAAAARATLVGAYGWSITDGGQS